MQRSSGFRHASYANPSELRTPEISQRGSPPPVAPVAFRSLPPPPAVVRVGTTTSKSYIRAPCSLRSSARERRGGQGARSFTEGFARIGSPMVMGVAQMWAIPQGFRGCTRYKSSLKVRRPFLDPPRSARGAGRLDAVCRPSERLREFVDHMANVRHGCHKLLSAIVAFSVCGPVLYSLKSLPHFSSLHFYLFAHLCS